MRLPQPRGPISATLRRHLAGGSALPPAAAAQVTRDAAAVGDVLSDDDLQLGLAVCYELHYRGFDDVDERWEWEPSLLQVRRVLESRVEEALRREALRREVRRLGGPGLPVDAALRRLVDGDDGPALSPYLMRDADVEQFRAFVAQRSIYHLKEADPHTWAIPRVSGRAKAALVEIQADEYGGGRPGRMHSALFAQTMRALGLDDTYGAYWETATGPTFATGNLMSLFGLHRRWRGAALGHLAVLEMTSTAPNRRYGNGLRRLGFGSEATAFYDEHVEADAVHEQLAAVDLCGSFVADEPERRDDVLFGATCCLAVEARFAATLLASWRRAPASVACA